MNTKKTTSGGTPSSFNPCTTGYQTGNKDDPGVRLCAGAAGQEGGVGATKKVGQGVDLTGKLSGSTAGQATLGGELGVDKKLSDKLTIQSTVVAAGMVSIDGVVAVKSDNKLGVTLLLPFTSDPTGTRAKLQGSLKLAGTYTTESQALAAQTKVEGEAHLYAPKLAKSDFLLSASMTGELKLLVAKSTLTAQLSTLVSAGWNAQFRVFSINDGDVLLVPKLTSYVNLPIVNASGGAPAKPAADAKDPKQVYVGGKIELGVGLPLPQSDKSKKKTATTIVLSGGVEVWSFVANPKATVSPLIGISVIQPF